MIHEFSGAIPPTQLVVRSYLAYTGTVGERPQIPPTALRGFKRTLRLCCRPGMNESTNCVGGIFGTNLGENLFGFFSTLLEATLVTS